MRILAFSDLHEEDAALEWLAPLAKDYDCVFACGDIARSTLFAGSLLAAIPGCFVVPGNWDSEAVGDFFAKTPNWLHGKRRELPDGLNAVGFGYSNPTPFGTYGELSEAEIYDRMIQLPIDGSTLLLLHCPPSGFFDERKGRHVGSVSIRKVIEEKKPLAAFFGHIHEYSGTAALGPSALIKLPPANEMRACSVSISDKKTSVKILHPGTGGIG
ncbi:MAG TPA: metallophosphoesterase family protein [Candidatus Bilamarchaeum sp.]|nr:metallophosphoesterase family protein [Candidatus Bilamarchaeum sp.]